MAALVVLRSITLGHEAGLVIKQMAGPANAEMKLVFFDDKHCQMRVVANPDVLIASSPVEIGHAEKALAVCNGGYCDPGKLAPVGLEIANGKRAGKFDPWGWVGALSVPQKKTALVWQEEFRDSPDITQFVNWRACSLLQASSPR